LEFIPPDGLADMTWRSSEPQNTQLPPGRHGWPVFGETWQFVQEPRRFVLAREAQYGPIFRTHIYGQPTIFMVGPEALRFVLVTHQKHFTTGRGWPKGLRRLMDGALMMKDSEQHQASRRLLSPAFSARALEQYVSTIARSALKHIAQWAKAGEIKLYSATKLLMFDIASQLLMGRALEAEMGPLSEDFECYTRGMEGLHPILRLPTRWSPFARALGARKRLLRHIRGVLRDRRKAGTDDALSLLLEAQDARGPHISDADLSEQVLFLLFAGHESSTSLMTMACLELVRHPALLQRMREEQVAVRSGQELSLKTVNRMELLDRVVLETERLYPPFSGVFRSVASGFEFAGYRVPAGWQVFYCIAGTHHLDRIYANPGQFDPDRFLPPRDREARQSCSLAGFGNGGHICLGKELARLEVKIMLALLLSDYDLSIIDRRLDLTYVPSIRPKNGMRARLARRPVASSPRQALQ
jgi:cytochrome P450